MKNIKRVSTASTLICIISVLIYIMLILFLVFGGTIDSMSGFASDSINRLDGIDSNSPSAGFEVLAYLAGGALGVLGSILLFVVAIMLGGLSLYQLPAIISGVVSYTNYKKNADIQKCLKTYRIDGYIKAIMNGLVVAAFIPMILENLGQSSLSDFIFLYVILWNYIIVCALGILQIILIKNCQNKILDRDDLML